MKILLAHHFGMCFGVRDALAQAENLAQRAPLTILGELVHNPIVRERLRAQGVAEASLDDPSGIGLPPMKHGLEAPATPTRVMITAHGASERKRAAWNAAGFEVVDGTCPLVRHAHGELKQLVRAGYFPVVIGRAGHVEVRGLTEDFSDAVVVDVPSDLLKLPRRDRYGVISQTTQPIQHVELMLRELRSLYPEAEVKFSDTVCKPTKNRQDALEELISQAELIVVVGGRESNNTRQLAATCRKAGRRTFHIERPDELRFADFAEIEVVGLTAGTSTLRETVEAVRTRLEEIAAGQLNQPAKRQPASVPVAP